MRIADMNWMQVEEYLKSDDRAAVPLGSTEQHAYLSLSVDSILADRVAVEAAEPLGIPVFPVLAYGVTPYFRAYPGSVSLRLATYLRLVEDILDSLAHSGFRRILLVNGHGGNAPAETFAVEWLAGHPDRQLKFHNWWRAPRTWAHVQAIDPAASHASWMENFPWTRLPGLALPDEQKIVPARPGRPLLTGEAMRAHYGDGNFAGRYHRPDEEMLAIWQTAVQEARALLEGGWE
ncbi:MAG: creatininase family protein [Chloroflexi bacterium]|nr:creatininase family protein [Chloroflexota bacterium]MCI0577690.1 creatininase family protein [Chloroflexota bacterium]MCI0644590.1 creatininase family protein [Chloroflexota bacterium]MCI0728240.1 creatininase family protein [Chloroflexota bacterium]